MLAYKRRQIFRSLLFKHRLRVMLTGMAVYILIGINVLFVPKEQSDEVISDKKLQISLMSARDDNRSNGAYKPAVEDDNWKYDNISSADTKLHLEKMDWNDYDFYAREEQRRGAGEQGKALVLQLTDEEKKISDELLDEYQYDAFVSDQISVERATGDTRTSACKTQHFIKNIPENSVSVIIVFHNERNSTLLRTVHSVVNRSPATLLREVILVDDLSVKEELKTPLDLYITKHFTTVKIIRNNERLGLIRSRIAGADASSGTFLVFFDAHVEVNFNYLPPLLEPIVINYRTITCPMVDTIEHKTFEISRQTDRIRGGFDWKLHYKRIPVEFEMDETTPHPSPVMIGCAFAISRKWWDWLDKYDRGLEIWGGEQFELSFKSWMCGGRVVDAPCSRVAHLFRPLPYMSDIKKDHKVELNYLRIATVWMDSYVKFVKRKRRQMHGLDPGDLTKQFILKKKLNCKSFRWYINTIAPDVFRYFPIEKPSHKAWGKIRSKADLSVCLMSENNNIVLKTCNNTRWSSYAYDWKHHISFMNVGLCWANPNGVLIHWPCLDFEKKPTQKFAWNPTSGHIVNYYTHLCVDVDANTLKAFPNTCDLSKKSQSWSFDNFKVDKVNGAWNEYAEYLARYRNLHYFPTKEPHL